MYELLQLDKKYFFSLIWMFYRSQYENKDPIEI